MNLSYSISQRKKNIGITTWYLRTNAGGKVTYKSLKTKSKKEAAAKLAQLNTNLFFPKVEGSGDVSVVTMIDEWMNHIKFAFFPNLNFI